MPEIKAGSVCRGQVSELLFYVSLAWDNKSLFFILCVDHHTPLSRQTFAHDGLRHLFAQPLIMSDLKHSLRMLQVALWPLLSGVPEHFFYPDPVCSETGSLLGRLSRRLYSESVGLRITPGGA